MEARAERLAIINSIEDDNIRRLVLENRARPRTCTRTRTRTGTRELKMEPEQAAAPAALPTERGTSSLFNIVQTGVVLPPVWFLLSGEPLDFWFSAETDSQRLPSIREMLQGERPSQGW